MHRTDLDENIVARVADAWRNARSKIASRRETKKVSRGLKGLAKGIDAAVDAHYQKADDIVSKFGPALHNVATVAMELERRKAERAKKHSDVEAFWKSKDTKLEYDDAPTKPTYVHAFDVVDQDTGQSLLAKRTDVHRVVTQRSQTDVKAMLWAKHAKGYHDKFGKRKWEFKHLGTWRVKSHDLPKNLKIHDEPSSWREQPQGIEHELRNQGKLMRDPNDKLAKYRSGPFVHDTPQPKPKKTRFFPKNVKHHTRFGPVPPLGEETDYNESFAPSYHDRRPHKKVYKPEPYDPKVHDRPAIARTPSTSANPFGIRVPSFYDKLEALSKKMKTPIKRLPYDVKKALYDEHTTSRYTSPINRDPYIRRRDS